MLRSVTFGEGVWCRMMKEKFLKVRATGVPNAFAGADLGGYGR